MVSPDMDTGPKIFNLERLLDKRCFQQLPEVNIPPMFVTPEESLEKFDLDTLIEKKLYIAAASRAHNILIHLSDSSNYQEIFRLWYIRLSSLVLAHLWHTAREESRVLGDLGSDSYRLDDLISIVPWKLRVLAVSLQCKGNNQIGLTRYYLLAREATSMAHGALKLEKQDIKPEVSSLEWMDRLRQLGLYVAAMLMGMGDYLTAIDHLNNIYHAASIQLTESQKESKDGNQMLKRDLGTFVPLLASVIGFCYLQIGDTISARQWFQESKEDGQSTTKYELCRALCSIADADWSDAVNILESLSSKDKEVEVDMDLSEDIENNLALSQLHGGNLDEALKKLEGIVNKGSVNNMVLLNLFTLYDLQKAVSTKKKIETLHQLKENGVYSLGNYEFISL